MTTPASIRRGWKKTESRIAELLGGVRIPVSGRTRGDQPDIRHDWLGIEVKSRAELPAWLHEAMAQARAASRDDQLPIAVLHQVGDPYNQALVVLTLSWVEWFGGATECQAVPTLRTGVS